MTVTKTHRQAVACTLHHTDSFCGFCFQGPSDEDLVAATTEEPLSRAEVEESGSAPPEGPPLPIPTVTPATTAPPVTSVSGLEVGDLQRREGKADILGGAWPWLSQRCVFLLVCKLPNLGSRGASSPGNTQRSGSL